MGDDGGGREGGGVGATFKPITTGTSFHIHTSHYSLIIQSVSFHCISNVMGTEVGGCRSHFKSRLYNSILQVLENMKIILRSFFKKNVVRSHNASTISRQKGNQKICKPNISLHQPHHRHIRRRRPSQTGRFRPPTTQNQLRPGLTCSGRQRMAYVLLPHRSQVKHFYPKFPNEAANELYPTFAVFRRAFPPKALLPYHPMTTTIH